ncbi:hypothetical protein COB64_03905 [Candidatus Wolfebacteria bacterium]|nr:MAG: hypothetical protein COB64_03905 [Candidatus Wolfebacteria bacterium]
MNTKCIILLGVLVISSITPFSCKKGENDPFFSIRTRKARITGEWTLESGKINIQQNTDSTFALSFTGSTMSVNLNGSHYQDYKYSRKLIIDKDGTFSMTDVYSGAGSDYLQGIWYFAGKNKEMEMKNKEGLILGFTDVDAYSGYVLSHHSYVADVAFSIDRLSHKKMVLKSEFAYIDDNDNTIIQTETLTYSKEEKEK